MPQKRPWVEIGGERLSRLSLVSGSFRMPLASGHGGPGLGPQEAPRGQVGGGIPQGVSLLLKPRGTIPQLTWLLHTLTPRKPGQFLHSHLQELHGWWGPQRMEGPRRSRGACVAERALECGGALEGRGALQGRIPAWSLRTLLGMSGPTEVPRSLLRVSRGALAPLPPAGLALSPSLLTLMPRGLTGAKSAPEVGGPGPGPQKMSGWGNTKSVPPSSPALRVPPPPH